MKKIQKEKISTKKQQKEENKTVVEVDFSINLFLCTYRNGCFEMSTCAHWYIPVVATGQLASDL